MSSTPDSTAVVSIKSYGSVLPISALRRPSEICKMLDVDFEVIDAATSTESRHQFR